MKVRLDPAAREELHGARVWYEEQSPLSAAAFIQEVDATVSRIAEAPLLYPLAEHERAAQSYGDFLSTYFIE